MRGKWSSRGLVGPVLCDGLAAGDDREHPASGADGERDGRGAGGVVPELLLIETHACLLAMDPRGPCSLVFECFCRNRSDVATARVEADQLAVEPMAPARSPDIAPVPPHRRERHALRPRGTRDAVD